jgi:dihydrofolate reductase
VVRTTSGGLSVQGWVLPHRIAWVEKQGFDGTSIRRLPGLADLTDPDVRAPEASVERAWRLATTFTGDAVIGVHMAESLPRGALDLVEYAFRSSPSLAAGLERLARYGRVISDRVAARMETHGEGLLLLVRDTGSTVEVRSRQMKASVFIGTSLDGFIARTNGALDFLPPGGGEPHGYDEFMATVDALVIGRKTFETVLTFDKWPYGEKIVVVLSTRPLAAAPLGAVVERMSGTPAEIVSQLTARGIRHIYVDGGITIQRFLQDGLIQHLVITRVPVLIGTGIPLFGAVPRDIVLRHVGTRQYASGLVQSEYEVVV